MICSMTWNGQKGFQTPIANDSFLVDGIGALGRTHTERGLTYYEVALCGHMCVDMLYDCADHPLKFFKIGYLNILLL